VEIRIACREHTLVLALPEEFCPPQADAVLVPLARLLANPRTTAVTVDMRETKFLNAEGLTALRALAELAAQRDAPVTAVVPNSHLRRLLHVLDLDQIMEVAEHWPAESAVSAATPTTPTATR